MEPEVVITTPIYQASQQSVTFESDLPYQTNSIIENAILTSDPVSSYIPWSWDNLSQDKITQPVAQPMIALFFGSSS